MLKRMIIPALALVLFATAQPGFTKQLSDTEVKKRLIQESIDSYPGNCPCPYNTMRNGRACGGRSAYNRAGGYSPLCFPSDITPAMVKEYRQRMGGQ